MTQFQVLDQAPLTQDLLHLQEKLASQLPSELHARLSTAIERLVKSKPAAAALQVGESAPDFTLPDSAAHPVTLTQKLATGPVVLTFYRGSWCPFCDLQLRAYSRMVPQLARASAQIIAVSPQRAEAEVANSVEHRALGFPLLTDANGQVARQYGLVYSLDELMRSVFEEFGVDLAAVNGVSAWELPVPGTFIVTPDRRIRWAHVEADFRRRAEPDDILRALAAL